jgi:uncharacterized protein (DUF885 family)
MKNIYPIVLAFFTLTACNTPIPEKDLHPQEAFSTFETNFLDHYWKQYPSNAVTVGSNTAITAGYGKYYDDLVIPDSAAFAANVAFSKRWLDSLQTIDFNRLSDNNKISYNIISNQLQSDIWYQSVFNPQQWDASVYNLSNECYYIIHQPYAALDDRLRILTKHLEKADQFFNAAFKMLKRPTKESVGLAIMQNMGGLSIFGNDLTDSVKSSHLTAGEISTLNQHVAMTVKAINGYVDSLKTILADKNYVFRKFSIGKELYKEKFKYDLATNFSPEEIYNRAITEKKVISRRMFLTADSLWTKYGAGKQKPADSTALVQSVIDAISLKHARANDFFDSLKNQVSQLKRFVIVKDLFDFDTSYPIVVRIMPAYERGFAIASAEFTPPYQKTGNTYFNIDDITLYPKDKMESTLREMNDYTSQLISIHEAMPGHCLQGIYNNKKSPDVLRSVFQNGAMVEGWAVYSEDMMLENGWAGHAPEMQIMFDKLKLRELGNVIIDYQMQCLDSSKEAVMQLMTRDLFQTKSQAEEKYHRATLSQVQLCSYYAGASAILTLREEYKAKMGNKYSLKAFHENFLGYGSSPVKYIKERMLQ